MIWKDLTSKEELDSLLTSSAEDKGIFIFKHSTRCSISHMAKSRLERYWNSDSPIHYLDLISNREVSNLIAQKTGVDHESPQLLWIKDGECKFHTSHSGIDGYYPTETVG